MDIRVEVLQQYLFANFLYVIETYCQWKRCLINENQKYFALAQMPLMTNWHQVIKKNFLI